MNNWIIYLNLAIPSALMAMPFILRMVVPDGNYGVIAIISYTIILPLVLTILNISIFVTKIETSFLKCSLFMLVGLFLGNIIGYMIWGISTKNFFKPDAETVWVVKSLIIYHICFVVILFIIVSGAKFSTQFFKNKYK